MDKKYVIVVDATCDLSLELRNKYDIKVIHTYLTLPNKQEIHLMPEWDYYKSSDEFYTELKKNPNGFKTSPCNQYDYEKEFTKYIEDDYDILSICISTGLSGTYQFSVNAKNNVLNKYPDANIICVDSLRYSTALGLLCVRASINRSNGLSLVDNANDLIVTRNNIHQAGWLDDLSFLAKKGRLNNAKAFFGTLAGIKPIGEVDNNGLTTVLVKAKGARTAYRVLLDYIDKTIIDPTNQIIFIAQTNRMDYAIEYKKMIEERFKPVEVIINDVFPQCGVNIGPGLMACYYFGKPISNNLVEEKKILEELLEN